MPGLFFSLTDSRFAPQLKETRRRDLGRDALAGLTLAAVAVPQAIAYAMVAGLPPEMGLLAAALPCMVAALFGSSPYLVTGPTNPTALILASSLVLPGLAASGIPPIQAVLSTGLLVGVMLLAFGFLGMGRASRFLSDGVVVGFVTGLGVLIALRLVPALAPDLPTSAHPGGFIPDAWPLLVDASRALWAADPRTLWIAGLCPLAIWGLRRVDRRMPAALIVLSLLTALASAQGWTHGPNALATVGSLPVLWLDVALPQVPNLTALASPALALALLVTLQSVAASRSIRPPVGQRLDPDRELVAQGFGNIVSALVGGMTTSGSLTRTAVGHSAGARSRLAGLISGALIFVGLPWIGPVVSLIPMSALVGLVFLSGIELVRPLPLKRAIVTRGDAAVLVVTLGATLWINPVQALYIGVFLSLALLVRRSARLQMVELVRSSTGQFREIEIDDETGRTPAVLLHLEGDLNFALAPDLSDRLALVRAHRPAVVLLRLKRARHVDATVVETLRQSAAELESSGTRLVLCGLSDGVVDLLSDTDFGRQVGAANLIRSGEHLFEGFQAALDRVRELTGPGQDAEMFRSSRETETGRH